jgi:phospholipase C
VLATRMLAHRLLEPWTPRSVPGSPPMKWCPRGVAADGGYIAALQFSSLQLSFGVRVRQMRAVRSTIHDVGALCHELDLPPLAPKSDQWLPNTSEDALRRSQNVLPAASS